MIISAVYRIGADEQRRVGAVVETGIIADGGGAVAVVHDCFGLVMAVEHFTVHALDVLSQASQVRRDLAESKKMQFLRVRMMSGRRVNCEVHAAGDYSDEFT